MLSIAAVFSCDFCKHERKYGESLETDTNKTPRINCEGRCNKATPHTFVRIDNDWPSPPRAYGAAA